MRLAIAMGAAGVFLLATGCGMMAAPIIPPPAAFQNYSAPLDLDHQQTPRGSKRGESHAHSVLALVAWGDGSTRAAAQAGGLSTIESADYEFFSVLGLYTRYTTVVYGD